MSLKRWELLSGDKSDYEILSEECGIDPLVSAVLVNRGYKTFQQASDFLTTDGVITSPFEIKDMDIAVETIMEAVDNGDKITVYGDYDCDGVTSTVILYTYLNSIGADVDYYIPERVGEGYGLNYDAIDEIINQGTKLIITVDNGITAVDQIEYANDKGLTVVVTDHHQPGEILPRAKAVVNPHRKDCSSEFKELSGVGVAFKLLVALENEDYMTILDTFAEFIAIGTVADVVPMIGENKTIVKYGLDMMKRTDNIGLLSLLNEINLDLNKVSVYDVGFQIGPRINAAGRIGTASLAVELFLSENKSDADKIAKKLCELNVSRQNEEKEIVAKIEQEIKNNESILNNRVLVVKGTDWNHGILGIVASRLVDKYGKPTLVMTNEDDNLKGSARSIGEFHMYKALAENDKYLVQYGGHKLAAGFTLKDKDFESFKNGLEKYAKDNFELMPQVTLKIDKALNPTDITLDKIKALSVLEPFGTQNETPLFMLKNAKLLEINPISDGKHTKITLSLENTRVMVACFGMTPSDFPFSIGMYLDVAVTTSVNPYNGKEYLSVKLKDLRPSGFDQKKFFNAKMCYEKIKRQEPVSKSALEKSKPDRKECAVIYRYLKEKNGYNSDIDYLYLNLLKSDINYCKFRIILDALNETKLIELSPSLCEIKMLEANGKVNLEETEIMKYISERII